MSEWERLNFFPSIFSLWKCLRGGWYRWYINNCILIDGRLFSYSSSIFTDNKSKLSWHKTFFIVKNCVGCLFFCSFEYIISTQQPTTMMTSKIPYDWLFLLITPDNWVLWRYERFSNQHKASRTQHAKE